MALRSRKDEQSSDVDLVSSTAGDPTPGELRSELLEAPGAPLASALPESLTITVDLPAPVHSAPAHEAAVAIDLVTVNPGQLLPASEISTTSISVVPERHISHPVIAAEPEPAPVPVPPLPDHESTGYVRRSTRIPLSTGPTPTSPTATAPRGTPESASELTAERLIGKTGRKRRRPAPEGRWPEFVYAATLHLVNLGDSWRVRERKAIDARIAKEFEGSTRFVPVLTRKGGVGKTTITTLIGMAMADVRDDRVIAIDANPDRGTLSERVSKQTRFTVREVVKRAPSLSDFTDFSTLVSRDETRLDVLASDTDPMLSEAFNEDDYNVVADLAAHFYSIVLTDCGTGIVHSVMRATLQRADSVVIVSGGSVDEARLASETLTWLEANGYGDLVKNAVVALNTATQGTNLVKLEEIVAHFQSRVRAIVRIPYDPQLAAGSVVDYKNLKPFTRESARELAALVADGLPATRNA
jgi:MinD-like ATPase involved in chromosome partitioning or flagellar assembly